MSTITEIETAIEKLPKEKIEELAVWLDEYRQKLAGDFDPEIETAWKIETRRRIAEIESGRAEFIPREQVMAELRKIAGR